MPASMQVDHLLDEHPAGPASGPGPAGGGYLFDRRRKVFRDECFDSLLRNPEAGAYEGLVPSKFFDNECSIIGKCRSDRLERDVDALPFVRRKSAQLRLHTTHELN